MKRKTILILLAMGLFIGVPLVVNTEVVWAALSAPFVALWNVVVTSVAAVIVIGQTWLGVFS